MVENYPSHALNEIPYVIEDASLCLSDKLLTHISNLNFHLISPPILSHPSPAVPPEIEPPIPPAKESVTLDVGAPLLLSASLSNPGIPRGNISFVKNGVALGGGVDPRITVTPSGVDSVDLRITELVPADQGVYTIHAINDLGLMDEQTRSVFVRCECRALLPLYVNNTCKLHIVEL